MSCSVDPCLIPCLQTLFHLNLRISIFFLHLLPFARPISFNLPQFIRGTTDMQFEGDASISQRAIQLNRVGPRSSVGRATFAEPLQLWSTTQNLTNFTTHFSFTVDPGNSLINGHGFTFFLTPAGSKLPPNSYGGFLGLFNSETYNSSAPSPIVAVEFDSHPDKEWDPLFEHVGININSLRSVVYMEWNVSKYNGKIANVWIDYDSSAKKLGVYLSYGGNPSSLGTYNLSYDVDLKEILTERVAIGFSAATTGDNKQRHIIHSWDFSSSLDSNRKNSTNPRKKKQGKLIWVFGLVAFVCVSMGGLGVAYLFMRKRRRTEKEDDDINNQTSIDGVFEREAGPKGFSYEELVEATDNFSDERKLGQGGFGGVYRGILGNSGSMVAVKKISKGSRQGRKEYMTEVKTISRLRHRNLVKLVGWCHDRGEFLLVYELMPNGSLDSHIFGEKCTLEWAVRYKIVIGLASALLYLHEEWEQCVLHRDIKSSNVMLDSSFNARLGDFGLARLMDHEADAQTTAPAGTLGYLAPECFKTLKASKESDVYSFGVVALEIACGRKPVEFNEEDEPRRLVDWVWEVYGRRRLLDAADERLDMDFDAKQMECLMVVGLWCAHPNYKQRPSIRQVIQVLHFEADLRNTLPDPTHSGPPGPTVHSNAPTMTFTTLAMGR